MILLIDIYDDDIMVCGFFTTPTVTTSLRSVIDTAAASMMYRYIYIYIPIHKETK